MAETGPRYPYNKDTNPTGYKPGSIEERKAQTGTALTAGPEALDEYGNPVAGSVFITGNDGSKKVTTIGALYASANNDIKVLAKIRASMAKYQQVATDASSTTVLAAYLKSLIRASAMQTDVESAWKDALASGFTVNGADSLPSTTISSKGSLGTQIKTEFQTMFAEAVPEDVKNSYIKEINDLQISRATKTQTIKGKKISVSSAVTEQEQKNILNKYLKQYASQKITLANSGNALALASLQKGNFGITYTTLKNAYYDNGLPVNQQALGQDTIEASLNPERQKSILNLINLQAKTYFPALSDKIDAGYTVRQLLTPYINTRANILEEDATSVDLKQLQSVAKDPKGLMGLYDYEVSLRKDPKWKTTKNALDTMSGLARDMTKMFGLGA